MGFFDINPQQIAGMSAIGSTFGAISSGIGAYYGAQMQQINLQHAAFMSDLNAKMAEKEAQYTLDRGQKMIGQLTLKAGQLKSSQRARMAANGIDLGEGSAGEILASTDIMKESDALTISADATRAAWNSRIQSTNYSNDAMMKRVSANGISPFSAMTSSLLGSAGSVANSWYKYSQIQPDRVR